MTCENLFPTLPLWWIYNYTMWSSYIVRALFYLIKLNIFGSLRQPAPPQDAPPLPLQWWSQSHSHTGEWDIKGKGCVRSVEWWSHLHHRKMRKYLKIASFFSLLRSPVILSAVEERYIFPVRFNFSIYKPTVFRFIGQLTATNHTEQKKPNHTTELFFMCILNTLLYPFPFGGGKNKKE